MRFDFQDKGLRGGSEPRKLLERQLEEIRSEAEARSACLIVFGLRRAQVLGTVACSVEDLDQLRQWRPEHPPPESWEACAEAQNDLQLVLCLKSGSAERVQKMVRAYLLQWLAALVYADPA